MVLRNEGREKNGSGCYEQALRLLQYRWRSVGELRDRLAKRGHAVDAIEEALETLTREGWLDDRRFAAELVRSRMHRFGERRLAAELRRRQVDPSITSDVLDDVAEEVSEEAIDEAVRRKAESLVRRYGNGHLATQEGRARIARFLTGRGFRADQIHAALDRLEAGEDRE